MILIVYPMDPTTKRLGRIASFLHRHLPNNRLFVVRPTQESKNSCHKLIKNCNSDDLIIFLGHGCSDALYGARGRYYNAFCDILEDADPELYGFDDFFLEKSTYAIFNGKKCICYGCKTADLGKHLVESGAISILGFGAIPTSQEEYEDFHIRSAHRLLVSHTKGAVTSILKHGIVNAITNSVNFAELSRILEFEIQREIDRSLSSRFRFKKELVDTLHTIKRDIRVLGVLEASLI